ncbi:MerR family transcriptional regulator [Saccharothrix longispora]|uniref:DNA-binding transcriptional MerR regulator n=1 Tax=Saccharothrix longispora TaxID=33920 RepID=A0ABU1Q1K6_9PSEU|nr:MerR family transcriptional regulator [Saccharothrix longispora]MDR6596782.1 DNA-binding transcriptional MerR regulator [Saccharothrix longispora]
MTTPPDHAATPPGEEGGSVAAEGDPEHPLTLSVAAVARRLGVAPATLRTWDRRYGLGPGDHTTGRHRKYAPRDVARLELMQQALLRGASSAEAAEYALTATATATATVASPATPSPPGRRALRLRGANRLAGGLARAVVGLDQAAAQTLLADAVEADGVLTTWTGVISPVLAAVTARREPSGAGAEVSHLLEECVRATLARVAPIVTEPRNHRPVLLACAPGERYDLPLHPLAAELARRGVDVRNLGPALPVTALVAAVRRTAPAAVVVWAHLPRYADPAVIAALPRTRQQFRVLAGGPGWRRGVVPHPAERATDPAAAATAVERAVCHP